MLRNASKSLKNLSVLALMLAAAPTLPAPSAGPSDDRAPAETLAQAAETEMVFTAGEELIVAQNTSDDIFAAGSIIDARGPSADHLFLAGGDITISGAQVKDVIAAGGEIRLNTANVTDDVIVAGGEIMAAENFVVGGSAVIAGGEVRFEAPVGQDLRIGANEIFVNSVIPGTAKLSGEKIVLGPKTRIGGDLIYRGASLTVDPAAVIEGQRTELARTDDYAAEDFAKGVGQFFLIFSLSLIISYFVIVALLVLAVPGLMRSTSEMLQNKPWQALGIGVLYALIVPIIGIILLWTGVGIPLALLLFVASLALTPIAVAVTAHFIGMAGRSIIAKKTEPASKATERFLWPLGGVVVLFGLALVPLAGLVVMLLALLFGLGALLKQVAGPFGAPTRPAAATA